MSMPFEALDLSCTRGEQDQANRYYPRPEENLKEGSKSILTLEPQPCQNDADHLVNTTDETNNAQDEKKQAEKMDLEAKPLGVKRKYTKRQAKDKQAADEQTTEKRTARPRGRPKRAAYTMNPDTGNGEKKPYEENLKSHSGNSVRTSSPSFMHSVDNSLGETLATSLQLIATNDSSPPPTSSLLEQSSYSRERDSMVNSPGLQRSKVSTLIPAPQSPEEPLALTYKPQVPVKKKRGRKPSKRKAEVGSDTEDKYLSDSEMMKPILHNDGSVTLFQCEICHKLFNKRQTLRQHFITHTDRFACQFCDARCKSKGDLRTHIQTHTKEKPYHCDICNTDYTRESILRKHLKTQLHVRAVQEKDMLLQVSGSKGLRSIDHFFPSKTKVSLGGFSCQQCSKVLLTRLDYKKHIKSHSLKHICNVCQKGCKTALLLKIHLRSHNNDSKLTCKTCARKFSSLQCLKDHLKTHKTSSAKELDQSLIKAVINKHNKDLKMLKVASEAQDKAPPKARQGNPPLKKATHECSICHRMFTSIKRLANHCQTHKGIFACTVCSKSFPTEAKLTNHMVDHEKQGIKCEICHAYFSDENELNLHVEKCHCEGSELVCKICYKKFESASEVHKHMNDHAPTMLFSGGSLDESSIPVVNRGKRVSHPSFIKMSETDDSSDDERKPVIRRNGDNISNQKEAFDDDDHKLNNSDFVEIMNIALDMDDAEDGCEELSDLEDDMFSSIVEVLESEVLSSAESDDLEEDLKVEEVSSSVEKPILYCHGDIVRKHGDEFEQYSHKDPAKGLYQCTLCDISFDKEKFLSDHLKCHVCEYCNKFFTDKAKLSVHKSNHVKHLLSKIDSETRKMYQPKPKWRFNSIASSDSEADNEDRFLNELEDILESDTVKNSRATNFLKTLSHDDIVKVNKPMFDEHSFVDVANNIFACTICKRKYARPTTLTRHFKTHVCQYCNTFFTDKSDLLEHKYRHRKRAALMKAEITGEGGKMPPSPVVSKENRALFKRFSFVDAERNINRCTLCSKDFVRRTVLTRHLKTHICSHCDKFFEDKYDLIKHATYHKVDKHYLEDDGDDEGDDFIEYEEEPKRFPQPPPLASLGEKALSIPSSFSSTLAPYSSPFHAQPSCTTRNEPITYIQLPGRGNGEAETAQVYSTQSNGTSSFQIISQPVNMYKANASDTFLVSTSNCQPNDQDKIITISQPQIVQADSGDRERLFECGECGKRFFKNGHLKSHMTIHTGSRPYVCSVCGKAFGRGTTLRKHEKTHIKRCKICDTTFASKYELELHLEIHRTYAFYK